MPAIFIRRTANGSFESAAEILRILVSEIIGDFADGFIRVQ